MQSDETVPAYLVVFRFLKYNGSAPCYEGKIFLKSRVPQDDIFNFLESETIEMFSINHREMRRRNFDFRNFATNHRFKILLIIEKRYRADFFDERGEFIAEKIYRANRSEPIFNPSSLIDLSRTACKNQLVKNGNTALQLISILPIRLIAQIMRCRPTIERCNDFNNNWYGCDPTLVKLSENEIHKTLEIAFIESLFDSYVPYFHGDEFINLNPIYFECGVSKKGRFSFFDSYYGRCHGGHLDSTPVTREMIDSFFEIQKLLTPYLDFDKIIFYDVEPKKTNLQWKIYLEKVSGFSSDPLPKYLDKNNDKNPYLKMKRKT